LKCTKKLRKRSVVKKKLALKKSEKAVVLNTDL